MAGIQSFKLRFVDAHVRVVPSRGGTGIDLRTTAAEGVFEAAAALRAALEREQGATLRAVSIRLSPMRAIATFDRGAAKPEPRRYLPDELRAWVEPHLAPVLELLEAQLAAKLSGDRDQR